MQTVNCFDDTAVPVSLCPGRARIRVPRLYRSAAEKARIEAAASTHEHVSAVFANPLTGKVLILFDGAIAPGVILAALGLAPVRPAAKQEPRTLPAQTQPTSVRRQAKRNKAAPAREIYPPWHLRDAHAALDYHQSSSLSGLSENIVEQRLRQGLNLLPQKRAHTALELLLNQFKSLPVLLLGVSAGLSLLTGGIVEALAIGAVLAMNGGIGFVTERRAESSIALLSELIDDVVPVLRNGTVADTQASHIVPGDILVLAPGIRIAADARLVQANDLMLDESALTGESQFVRKEADALRETVALADRRNMAYMGTAVTAGTGLAVVVGTGANTEIGTIQALMDTTEQPKTPIQKQLDYLGNRLVGISLGICAGVFGIGLLRGHGMLQMLKSSISLAIAAVPEGLPTVATTSLARGLRLMREKQMLIRRLQAIETLGAIHTICLDKTGTLTMNRMSVVAMQAGQKTYESAGGKLRSQDEPLRNDDVPETSRLLQVCALCNENGNRNGGSSSSPFNGSATENALTAMALDAGIDVGAMRNRYPLLDMELRAEGRNYMKTVHRMDGAGRHLIAIKGSPLEVLALCRYRQQGRDAVELTAEARAGIVRQNEAMAERQLRVLGFAYAEKPAQDDGPGSDDLIWLGLAGLADPLRAGADKVIADLHGAGIRTIMVTGDQRTTAQAIGTSLKIHNGGELHILDSTQLDQASHKELETLLAQVDIFARISPARKLEIVQDLQETGKVIAMTGDGINDGPALQAADVGIAMGLHGTDLARSAADVVLKDDRLETVLEAIRQGRTITGNIEKSLHFLVSSNLSEILVMLGTVSITDAMPLTPMQLLWINLLSDVLPAIALAAEPAETDLMRQPPRDAGKPLIGNTELRHYAVEGGVLAGGALGPYLYGLARHGPGPQASAIAFNSLVLGQLLHAFSCRSERHGIFSDPNGVRNAKLDLAIGGSIALQILVNLMPGARRLFGIGRMGFTDITVSLAGAGIPLLLNEAAKSGRRKKAGNVAAAAAANA